MENVPQLAANSREIGNIDATQWDTNESYRCTAEQTSFRIAEDINRSENNTIAEDCQISHDMHVSSANDI